MTKPRKKYRPKLAAIPLGMRDNASFELPALLALEALGQSNFCEQHVYDMISAADLTKRTAPAGHAALVAAQTVVEACADIQDCARRTGKTGVTGDEMRVLRAGVPQLITFLRSASNLALARAVVAAHADFVRFGGLRV
jgi:hypothetical protein